MTNEFDRNNGYQEQNFIMRDPEPSENSGADAKAGGEQQQQYKKPEPEYTEARTFDLNILKPGLLIRDSRPAPSQVSLTDSARSREVRNSREPIHTRTYLT